MSAVIFSLQLKFYSCILHSITSDSNIFGPPPLSNYRFLILSVVRQIN